MGRIISDGIDYSGLVYANGCFIDTDNVIKSSTQYYGSMSYTATEDCYVGLYIVGVPGSDVAIKIDNKWATSYYYNATLGDGNGFYLKKGQTLTVTGTSTQYDSCYVVYGLMQGSPITFLSEYASACYSDTEREVGCWLDGKPIYQTTVHIGNLTFDTNWHNVAHGIANIDKVISCEGILFGVDGEFFPLPNYRSNTNQGIVWGVQGTSSEYIAYINNWYNSTNDAYATLRYTKTTDTAGSGHLTPTGTPTVHYSENEQVIGTWINGKPLYECTLTLGALPNNAIKTVPHGIANVDLIFVSDSFFQTGAGASSYLNFTNDTTAGQIEILVNKTNVEIWAGTDRTSWNGYATVRYTKTTD